MEIENIIGAKSKLRIIEAMAGKDISMSIKSISDESGVAYSVCHRDVGILLAEGFLIEEDGKFRIDRSHRSYGKIAGLFSDDSGRGIALSNRQRKDIERIVEELKKHEKVNILVHHNADPDAVGSACALAIMLKHMGREAVISAPLGISLQGRAVLERFPFAVRDDMEKNASVVVVVDSSSFEQLGPLEFRTKPALILVDHHIRGDIAKAADMSYVDTYAHSCAILVYRMLKVSRADVWKKVAPFLLSGIVADTGFFRLADKEDISVVDELLDFVELATIFEALSVKEDISERIAKLKVLQRAEIYRVRDLLIAFSKTGSFESRAAVNLVRTGADVAFVFNVKKDEIRISGRMRKFLAEDIDLVRVLRVAESLIAGSVGGHAEAASANGKGVENAGKIKRAIVAEFERRAKSVAKVVK